MKYIISQVLGGVTVILMIIALFLKNKKHTMVLNSVSNIINVIIFLLLERYVALWLTVGGAVRSLVFAFWQRKDSILKNVIVSFFILYFIVVEMHLGQMFLAF